MRNCKLMLFMVVAIINIVCQINLISADAVKVDAVKIQIASDRETALYKCGEKAAFKATITKNDKPLTDGKVTVRFSKDGVKTISKQDVDLAKGNPFKVEGSLTVPGFLQCDVIFDKEKGMAGVGFEPEKIQPAVQPPEDFMKFWSDSMKELEKIPMDVKMVPLPKFSTPEFDCYKISFANIDNTRIYGFLTVPKGKKGPFPAIINVPGAGPGHWSPDTGLVKKGAVVLRMNVHQYDPPTDEPEIKKIYAELNKTEKYGYQGAPDRDKYYFKKSILGVNRAINWLAANPDVDKERMVMLGTSQGGAFTLIMAGLNKNIKAGWAGVPALCDQGARLQERNPGWPMMVTPDNPEKLKMSGYFDTINFARYITCPIIVSVGFIDTTCSPSSVYAAYNVIQSTKKIYNEPAMGHTVSPKLAPFQTEWLKENLGLAK